VLPCWASLIDSMKASMRACQSVGAPFRSGRRLNRDSTHQCSTPIAAKPPNLVKRGCWERSGRTISSISIWPREGDSTIVLGGSVTAWGERFLSAVEREVHEAALPLARESADIVIGEAGEFASSLGSSALVLQRGVELLKVPKKSLSVRVQAGGN